MIYALVRFVTIIRISLHNHRYFTHGKYLGSAAEYLAAIRLRKTHRIKKSGGLRTRSDNRRLINDAKGIESNGARVF
ncbi:hypothetical protein [Dyella sp. 2RAB6]|uniref:hypothetical protein n=1 Tax=Dyella sp. 2RAB6 TaxID=3232992 RepID=UPI003F8FD852